jgi:hypothetical protein
MQFHPKIVTDEKMHPIAVQIDYNDWLKIQSLLEKFEPKEKKRLDKYAGSIKLNEDPLNYQKRMRNEWD